MNLLGVPHEAIGLGLSEADTAKTEAPTEKRRLCCCYRALGLLGLMGFIGLMGAIKLFTFSFFIMQKL